MINQDIWMTQNLIAELFGVSRSTITEHINTIMSELFDVNVPAINKHLTNIYDEKELEKDSTISKMEIVRKEGNCNDWICYGDDKIYNEEYWSLGYVLKVKYYLDEKSSDDNLIYHVSGEEFLLFNKFRLWSWTE